MKGMGALGALGSLGALGMPKIPRIPKIPSHTNRLPMCLILRKILKKQNPFMENLEKGSMLWIIIKNINGGFHHGRRNVPQHR